LWLAAVNPDPLKIVERSPLGMVLGHEVNFFDLRQIVEAWRRGEIEPLTRG